MRFRFKLHCRHLLIALLLMVTPTASAVILTDIAEYPYKSSIDLLQLSGIVGGYPDGSFRPYSPINRAEFLKILMIAVFGDNIYGVSDRRCFADFTGEEQWYWLTACAAKKAGIVQGHPDGTFRGEATVNLAEALKMSLEAWNVTLPAANAQRPWFERYMSVAAERNIFKRLPFSPEYPLSRGEMALLLTMLGEPIATISGNASSSGAQKSLVNITFPPAPALCGDGKKGGTEQCDDGNIKDGDGCSSLCIVVTEPIRHGAIRIEQRSIASDVRTSGAQDLLLFSMDALAGRQDVYLTTLKFTSAGGSLQNARNYRLVVDQDGDGVTESLFGKAEANGESLVFGNLSILVKDGRYKRIELIADIVETQNSATIAVAFDTAQSDFIEGIDKIDAEDVAGIKFNDQPCQLTVICWVTVVTGSAQTVVIGAQGNLYVTHDTLPLGPTLVLAGVRSEGLLRVQFRADGEDILIKDFAVTGVPASADRLELWYDGVTSAFATLRQGQCESVTSGRFCTDNDFVIPRNGEKDVIVRAVMKPDTEGAVSGQSFALSLSSLAVGNVAVKAQGYYSGQQLAQNDGDSTAEGEIFIGVSSAGANAAVTGQTETVVLAKIIDITNINADLDGTPVVGGGMALGKFRFAAADHTNAMAGYNTATIDTLVFSVSAVNVSLDASEFRLYNAQNSGVAKSCSASATTGTITVTCSSITASSVNTFISRGDKIDLVLSGVITSPQITTGTSILQASLQSLSNSAITGTVVWSDGNQTYGWVDIGKSVVRSTNYRNN